MKPLSINPLFLQEKPTTLYLSNLKPLTTIYNEYIDQPILAKSKIPVERIVPPPPRWVGTNREREGKTF